MSCGIVKVLTRPPDCTGEFQAEDIHYAVKRVEVHSVQPESEDEVATRKLTITYEDGEVHEAMLSRGVVVYCCNNDGQTTDKYVGR